MKSFLLLILLGFISCHSVEMAKGVKKDFENANKKNKEYMYQLYFKGVVKDKIISKAYNVDNYELKLKLMSVDSIPNLVNRKYLQYFAFDDESTLRISVNKQVYNQTLVNDSIIKEKNNKALFLKRDTNSFTLNWLGDGNEWLPRNDNENYYDYNGHTPTLGFIPPQNITSNSAKLIFVNNPVNDTLLWCKLFLTYPDENIDTIFIDSNIYCHFDSISAKNINYIGKLNLWSYTLMGLKPGLPYSYRVMAMNIHGIVESRSFNFITLNDDTNKFSLITLNPSEITRTSARLRGIINPNSTSFAEFTTALFEFNKNASDTCGVKNKLTGKNPITIDFVKTNLLPGKKYCYRFSAVNLHGFLLGDEVCFTTLP